MNESNKKGFERRWYTKVMDRYRWSPVYIPGFNTAARTGLRLKCWKDRQRVEQACAGKQQEIEQWFNETPLFFGFSSIRGGTVFLANMLSLEVPNAHIEHEANVIDYWELPKARLSEADSLAYVEGFRRNEIYTRAPRGIQLYGEINPFIRRHCKAFKTVFPDAKLFHMVRHPREVVRSVMSREILSRKDPMGQLMMPPPWDPYHQEWGRMSRFERVCWEWQDDNRYMREHVPNLVRFEDMIGDYAAFKDSLLDYLGVDVPEENWARFTQEPRNVTRNSGYPGWAEWSESDRQSFERICGPEMAEYGY